MKYIKLFENFNNTLDLSDEESVYKWLKENAPDQFFDESTGEIDWSYRDPMTGDTIEDLINEYSGTYKEIMSQDEIEIYRMIMLDSIDDLNLKNVGVFWSFKKDGVGAYGLGKDYNGDTAYTLTAIVDPNDINWEQGFYSFLAYGTSEYECYMNEGSKCLITHINDEELENPIEGIC